MKQAASCIQRSKRAARPGVLIRAHRVFRRPFACRAGASGFSLMELIMVITILGIVLGAVVPNLRPLLEGTAIKRTATLLADVLRYARSSAIQHTQQVRLMLNQETGELIFTAEADPFQQPGVFHPVPLPVQLPKELGGTVQIARIEKIDQAAGANPSQSLSWPQNQGATQSLQQNSMIEFAPDGSTTDTFIYLTNAAQSTVYTVGIVGITGQVLVWDSAVESFYAE